MTRFAFDFAGFLVGAILVSSPAFALITSYAVNHREARSVRWSSDAAIPLPERDPVASAQGVQGFESGAAWKDTRIQKIRYFVTDRPITTRKDALVSDGRTESYHRKSDKPVLKPGRHSQDLSAMAETEARYEITGYAHGCILPRSGKEGPPRRMASGKWPRAGLHVAADTSLHPFGTELHIEGVGLRTVGDRGHAIKGRRLDLFLGSCQEAREFGRRWLAVVAAR